MNPKLKSASEDCLQFWLIKQEISVAVVPFESLRAIPRTGDLVSFSGLVYKVIEVRFEYSKPVDNSQPNESTLTRITVSIEDANASKH